MNAKRTISHLRRTLLLRMVFILVFYTATAPVLYFLAYILFSLFTWQPDDLLYIIAAWCRENGPAVVLGYIIVGYLLIGCYFFSKPFAYLSEIIEATESVYKQDEELISLSSSSLSPIEVQMNQLKMNLRNNQQAARDAEKRKNDLVAYLAHDLKTPITSLIGYLSLLKDEPQISEETRDHYLSISLDKAQRLDELINEFFEITRFNLSTISLSYSRIDLTRMLEQLVSEFQPMLREKSLSVRLSAPESVSIYCDPDKLQRVFDNLLRNAVAYSFEGQPVDITLTLPPGTGEAQIVFRNRGNTIPPDKLSRIFEQFYRLDTSRGSGSGGAGLGLAIAKDIVELHHGHIEAASQDEEIVFTVWLPLR